MKCLMERKERLPLAHRPLSARLKTNKQTNKQKKEKENSTIPLFDSDLFYFPLVDVITGSLH